MKRTLLFLSLCFALALPARAQLHPSVLALVKNAPKNLKPVSTSIARQIFRSSRANLKAPASLLPRMQCSIVQISLPHLHPNLKNQPTPALASGFLLEAYGRIWVASAYHVMGAEQPRLVRMLTKDGKEKEVLVQSSVHGVSGWHEPDLSLAPIKPEDIPEGMKPLKLANPDLNAPAYSVGYVAGEFHMDDIVAVRRTLMGAEGINLLGTYHIEGSTEETPITGNGQCGSPIVQQDANSGEWRVVGMHNGHLQDLKDPSLSRGSGVNLSIAVPYLLDPYFDEGMKIPSRPLYIRGFLVGMLQDNERVALVGLLRDGKFMWIKNIQKFANPYSDEHAELAFEDDDVRKGDEIRFLIMRRQDEKPKRSERTLTFIMP